MLQLRAITRIGSPSDAADAQYSWQGDALASDQARTLRGSAGTRPRRMPARTTAITEAFLAGRLVVTVWAPRDGARHIRSMRHAHDREARRWRQYLDGPG